MSKKTKWMEVGEVTVPIEKRKYAVPEGYKIIDGTSKISELKTKEVVMCKIK